MTESISANGTNLDDLVAQGVEGSSGIFSIPGKRGSDHELPGSDGALHVPGKRYRAGTVLLPMWVRGVNPDGSIPSDAGARLQFHQRLRELVALFAVDELVTIRHTLSDGSAREISGEVIDVLDFTIIGTGRNTLGKVGVALSCPDPFWADIADATSNFTLATGATVELDEFATASARMRDLTVTFFPGSNPRLIQPKTGLYLAYSGIIAAGRRLVVNCADWTVTGTVDAGGTWNPGTAPTQHIRRIDHGRSDRFFTLAPERPNPPVVRLEHTGGGTMAARISGRPRHLVA